MPWCPKCKCEYREGITECADCKVALVDVLPPDEENPYSEESEMKQMEQWVLEDNEEPDDESMQTGQDADMESKIRNARMKAASESVRVYQDKKSKAEDFKSSAYTLIIVGAVGIIALILLELGVFPFSLAAPGKYITYAVMGAMFLIFIIMGLSSFKSSKKYEKEAKTEDDLTDRIKIWTLENVTRESIVSKAALPAEMPDEVKYFKYFELLKNAIKSEFGDMNASYLESLCEELYGEIFEEN
ncbi:MAG: hypothetical protein MR531_07905 [Lachnospiraceae bacterium]|nr:hypothetical protein [Lachnospiraceae bacterium]